MLLKDLTKFSGKILFTKKSDILLLKSVVRFCSFIGTFPPLQFYKMSLLVLCQIFSIIFVTKGHVDLFKCSENSFLGILLFAVNVSIWIIFSLLCLKESYFHKKMWDDFYSDVKAFDVGLAGQKFSLDESICKYYLKFIFGCVFYIIMHLLAFSSSNRTYTDVIGALYFCLLSTQILVTTLVFEKLTNIFEKRYEFLTKKTKEGFLCKRTRNAFWNDQQLKTLSFILKNMVIKVNKLFGHRILIILSITVLDVISSFQYLIFENSQRFKNSNMLISISCQVIIFWVSIYSFFYSYTNINCWFGVISALNKLNAFKMLFLFDARFGIIPSSGQNTCVWNTI